MYILNTHAHPGTTAEAGYDVSSGRPSGTTAEAGCNVGKHGGHPNKVSHKSHNELFGECCDLPTDWDSSERLC